jgi:hypothetical protein
MNWLLVGSIRDRVNHPLPAGTAIPVVGPGRATAIPDLHLPVIVVGRNCERVRERSRKHHSTEHSDQKYAHHFSIPHNSFVCPS